MRHRGNNPSGFRETGRQPQLPSANEVPSLSLFGRHATVVHRLEYDKQACKWRPFHRLRSLFFKHALPFPYEGNIFLPHPIKNISARKPPNLTLTAKHDEMAAV